MSLPSLPMTLDAVKALLEGYTYVSWPDLAADRLASGEFYRTPKPLALSILDGTRLKFFTLGVTARVLATYCGVSDVLVVVRHLESSDSRYVRISWTNETSWETVASRIEEQLHSPRNVLTDKHVRDALELSDKQHPALFAWNDCPASESGDDHPISFSINPRTLQLSIHAPKNLLHPSVSQQIASQIEWLSSYVVQKPDALVADLPAPPPHLASIITRTPDNEIHSMFSHASVMRLATDYLTQRALKSPSSTAVQWYPELSSETVGLVHDKITYIDLEKRSNKLARWLNERGLEKEDRVAICMNRDIVFHVAVMGVMKSGGCYVPIDPELPEERKVYIARDSNAKFVLTSSDLSPADLFGPKTIYVDNPDVLETIEAQDASQVNFANPEDLAYMLYTSGTTGNPKGCLLTQRGLAQAILSLSHGASKAKMSDLTQGRYLCIASVAFDVHIAEIFVPLVLGMPLLSAPRSQLLEDLPLYVRRLGITHLGLVPSLIEATLNAAQEDGESVAIRYIASGGEKISDSILDKWAQSPQTVLANFYGPSEVTIGCCATIMTPNTPRANIGKPFANVSAYVSQGKNIASPMYSAILFAVHQVVDAEMNILLRGGVGELVVEGPLVGRGYHGRPDLTQKVFEAWPTADSWAYRTGDLVRMMPDSTIEILGRIDTQIKLRGVRIESEGISAIVRKACPPGPNFALDAVTVLAKHPSIGIQQLVSFISWDPSISVLIRKSKKPRPVPPPSECLKKIREVCEAELASYMRPSHIVPLNWLPLSSNGKADEKMLINLFTGLDIKYLTSLMDCGEGVQGRLLTDMEHAVYGILQQHVPFDIGAARPGISLFECGLDSMGIVKFTTAIKERFGQRLRVSDIMRSPTLEGMASLLETGPARVAPNSNNIDDFVRRYSPQVYEAYPKNSVEAIYPPFTIQEGVLSRSAVNDTLYVQHVLLHCISGVSISNLKEAWASVMSDQPILRTVFHFGKVLSQVVLKAESCSLPWVEREVTVSSAEEFVQWFHETEAPSVTKEINHNSQTHPPFSLILYRVPFGCILCLSIHHALYDGISLPLILDAVERAYSQLPSRPVATTSNILNHIAASDLSKARSFWEGHFAGYDWPDLEFTQGSPGQSITCRIPFKTKLSVLKSLATSRQVTLQALLCAAFANVLSSIYGKSDVTFGVIRSGRLLPLDNIQNSPCPLVTLAPLRLKVDARDILRVAQQQISEIVEHEHISLGRVQSWVRPGKPLFDTLFSVSVNDGAKSNIWNVIESTPPEADYVLSAEIVLSPDQDTLHLQAAWLPAAIDTKIVTEVFEQFESTVLSNAEGNIHSTPPVDLPSTAFRPPQPNTYPSVVDTIESSSIDASLLDSLRFIISDFLGVNTHLLGDTTSFISLGLDSIKSVGIARTLQAQGHKVSPVELMKCSSLKRLAALLVSTSPVDTNQDQEMNALYDTAVQQLRNTVDSRLLRLTTHDTVEIYPTTPLQAGMLSQTIGSQGKLYVHAFPLTLSSSADLGRIHSAWMAAVDQLSILRTSFHFETDSGRWLQAVHSVNTLDWSEATYSGSGDYESQLKQFIEGMVLREESDFHKPPIRVRLFRATSPGPLCHRLVFVLHHALYDGVSIGKLLDVIEIIYHGITPTKMVQFSDLLPHFVFQEQNGTSFWVQKLQGYDHLSLPRTGKEIGKTSTTASSYIRLDSSKLGVLHRAGATIQCLAQAAWAKLIASILNTQDVLFGHVVSGRSLSAATDVVGPVLNTIPCRVQLKGTSNADLLRTIQRDNVEALAWQQASMRSIQRQLQLESLWDSLFVFQPLNKNPKRQSIWEFEASSGKDDVRVQYALTVEFHQTEKGFLVKCAAHSALSQLASLDSWLERLEAFIANILQRPDDLAMTDVIGIVKAIENPLASAVPTCPNEVAVPEDYKKLQTLISSISNIPIQAVNDQTSLASLGIDSITAIQVANKCRQAKMKITAADIVSCRTFLDLTKKIQTCSGKLSSLPTSQQSLSLPPAEIRAIISRFGEASPIERILPMAPGQKFLLAAWQKCERRKYQHVFMFQLPEDVDKARLKVAWILLLQRHPLLRSTFANAPNADDPRIVVFKNEVASSTWSEEVIEDDMFYCSNATRVRQLVENPIPSKLPQARAILRYSKNKLCLLLHLHHFQYDAWSLSVLAEEISSIYKTQSSGPSQDLLTYLAYTEANDEQLATQDQYWKSVFPPRFNPTLFPNLNPHPVPRLKRTVYIAKSAIEDVSLCEKRAAELQVSLQSLLMACWVRLQSTYSRANDACFGVWHNGRTGSVDNIEHFAIPCVNILPMYVPDARGDIRLVAGRIHEALGQRAGIIEQTDFSRYNALLGIHKPLTNVFLNVFKLTPPGKKDGLLEPVNLPFDLPIIKDEEPQPVLDHLPITNLVQDDLSVDVVIMPERNVICVAIDASGSVLNFEQAEEIVGEFSLLVKQALNFA